MGGPLLVEHPEFRFKYLPKNPRHDDRQQGGETVQERGEQVQETEEQVQETEEQ
jgi:hypothetical protein